MSLEIVLFDDAVAAPTPGRAAAYRTVPRPVDRPLIRTGDFGEPYGLADLPLAVRELHRWRACVRGAIADATALDSGNSELITAGSALDATRAFVVIHGNAISPDKVRLEYLDNGG